jgi:hypothetical protein
MGRSNNRTGEHPMAAEAAAAGNLQVLTRDEVAEIVARAETYAADLTAKLGPAPDAERIAEDLQSASPKGAALVGAIEGLSRAAREELIALVWCGMGEYSFTEARAYSQATADKGTAQYIAKKAPVLSRLLRTALATLD